MKWEHTCSLEWMQERQKHLCASEVRQLVPFTKTGRPRKVTDEDYMRVLASKQKMLTTDDCISTGAAARGHILEPYAIDEFNVYAQQRGWPVHLWHWDDIVVKGRKNSQLAFSPDALNISSENIDGVLYHDNVADTLGEVKCYSTERHLMSMYTEKDKLEERWQIATAMASAPNLLYAWLIFYDPSVKGKLNLGIFDYDRGQLADEIAIVEQVEKDWNNFISKRLKFATEMIDESYYSEEAIRQKLEQESRLNPQ